MAKAAVVAPLLLFAVLEWHIFVTAAEGVYFGPRGEAGTAGNVEYELAWLGLVLRPPTKLRPLVFIAPIVVIAVAFGLYAVLDGKRPSAAASTRLLDRCRPRRGHLPRRLQQPPRPAVHL